MMLLLLPLLVTLAPLGDAAAAQAGGEDLVLAVDRLHVGDGSVLEDAVVLVAGGRIRSVTHGVAVPAGALHVPGAELTPGLVDAYSYMGIGPDTVEQASELTPSYSVADYADLDAPAFRHALAQGVTTAYLSPDSLNVIGGLGAVVKTGGGQPSDLFAPPASAARVLSAQAALKIALGFDSSWGNNPPWGSMPTNLYFRRPTTRMGSVWMLRSAFHQARQYVAQRQAGTVPVDPALEVLAAVQSGEIPVRVQARTSQDIQTALRLAAELGWKTMVLEEGSEAHRCAALIARAGVPVISAPLYDLPQRAVVGGQLLAAWRREMDPPAVCCEDLEHDHVVGEQYMVEDITGVVPVRGLALDLLAPTMPAASAMSFARSFEGREATPALPALLERNAVRYALGGAEAHDASASEGSLIQQARTAVLYGLDPARAIPSITAEAAALCGLEGRVGKVASGLDADLVLWSGPPLAASSRPLVVILDGRIALDHRVEATP